MSMVKWVFLFPFIASVLMLPLNSNADSIKRADKDDAIMLLNAASGLNSVYWAVYIGETRDRVYIEYTTAIHTSSFLTNKPKKVVYWIPASELSDEQLRLFKEYKEKFEGTK